MCGCEDCDVSGKYCRNGRYQYLTANKGKCHLLSVHVYNLVTIFVEIAEI